MLAVTQTDGLAFLTDSYHVFGVNRFIRKIHFVICL
jgi:hypothetical protein